MRGGFVCTLQLARNLNTSLKCKVSHSRRELRGTHSTMTSRGPMLSTTNVSINSFRVS